jgi:outer membrane protein OmpA-like peptidoglycan-associated protein
MNCPVCPRTDIAEGVLECPNCGVDLRPLLRLRELPRYRARLATQLLAEGRAEEAICKLQAALEDGGDAPRTRLLLGRAWLKLGNGEEAARQLAVASREPALAEEARQALRECADARESGPPSPSTTSVGPAAPPRARGVPIWVAAALGVLSVSSLLVAFARNGDTNRGTVGPAAASPESATKPSLPPSFAVARSSAEAASPGPVAPSSLGAERETIAQIMQKVPGIRAEPTAAGVRVVFLEGLFDGDSFVLERRSRKRLAAVADALESYARPLTIVVRGFTAPHSLGRDGDVHASWKLGFHRAAAAVVELHSTRLTQFTWRAAGPDRAEPPFAVEGERTKNRTVVLYIEPSPSAG